MPCGLSWNQTHHQGFSYSDADYNVVFVKSYYEVDRRVEPVDNVDLGYRQLDAGPGVAEEKVTQSAMSVNRVIGATPDVPIMASDVKKGGGRTNTLPYDC